MYQHIIYIYLPFDDHSFTQNQKIWIWTSVNISIKFLSFSKKNSHVQIINNNFIFLLYSKICLWRNISLKKFYFINIFALIWHKKKNMINSLFFNSLKNIWHLILKRIIKKWWLKDNEKIMRFYLTIHYYSCLLIQFIFQIQF
jgi:hypothetical protein